MKTQNCEHCRHANYGETTMRCGMGHKPRFYLPKHDMHGENWGYKRKCGDYGPGTPDGLTPSSPMPGQKRYEYT